MKRVGAILWALIVAVSFAQAADKPAPNKSMLKNAMPSRGVLIAAAKNTMLSQISYDRNLCEGDRNVETWLKDVTGETAARIEWYGGKCILASPLNPIDSGGSICGGATIWPKGHPKEPATIEIYFEDPVNGMPGKPYAFRAVNYDVDGQDYKRDWPEFEYGYREKYEKGFKRPEPDDCD